MNGGREITLPESKFWVGDTAWYVGGGYNDETPAYAAPAKIVQVNIYAYEPGTADYHDTQAPGWRLHYSTLPERPGFVTDRMLYVTEAEAEAKAAEINAKIWRRIAKKFGREP